MGSNMGIEDQFPVLVPTASKAASLGHLTNVTAGEGSTGLQVGEDELCNASVGRTQHTQLQIVTGTVAESAVGILLARRLDRVLITRSRLTQRDSAAATFATGENAQPGR
jgi:hypothetical protein